MIYYQNIFKSLLLLCIMTHKLYYCDFFQDLCASVDSLEMGSFDWSTEVEAEEERKVCFGSFIKIVAFSIAFSEVIFASQAFYSKFFAVANCIYAVF